MDNKSKKQLIITGILLVFLVFFILPGSLKQLKRPKSAKPRNVAKKNKAAVVKKLSKNDYADKNKLKELSFMLTDESASMKVKRDPFVASQQGSSEEMSPSGLLLCGIIWDKEKPLAIINEEIVGKGDKIGQYIVKTIEQDSVVLNEGEKDYKLNLSLDNQGGR